MLHLTKLAVGVRDIAHLRALQAERAARMPPLRHRTRNSPRRADEVTSGGSIYWVIGGFLAARQQVVEIVADSWDDGRACAALILNPTVVPVLGRPVKPFQGWRYLAASDAPEDVPADGKNILGETDLPAALRRDLRELCLL